MKTLHDSPLFDHYIQKYRLQEFMNADLHAIATLRSFAPDELLIHMGTPSDFLYFLVEGSVMIYSSSLEHQNVYINYAHPPTPLGEASSLWEFVPKSNVQAAAPCICIAISLPQYRKTLQNDLRFLQKISQLLSFRLNDGIQVAHSLTEPFEMRLARFLLEHEQNGAVPFRLTTCASILNVSYRHLLRTMTHFRSHQIITKKNNVYFILNYAALEKLANTPG